MSDTTAPPRRRIELTRAESLRLLRTVSLGRVVFTRRALPAIRPVNHVVDGGHIVIRTHEGAALAGLAATAQQPASAQQPATPTRQPGTAAVRRVVVAYEADAIDPVTHLGWSVVVTGYCMPVTDPDELARYAALLTPWWDGRMDYAVRIRPTLVTGVRLVPGCPHPPAPAC
ncbi:pyridoxamine 5'-phosphate oxidase family protein [Streptomyces roseoverticillatus]|uniref:pyridoxamine 5'-phosphate oxidase family protein n=1 Tax=Streptomyces roseoverticillatus TaxID=66429 RepID=UPI001F2B4E29|nr:pyridoxamine 5'-phosphate oxidase family protein [Streptomyces roseoverticillatus]MCF3100361.1 pyridoxamine 5'-phosphate oxidase family protein [Streptomyces roseoverticillatus]